MDTTIGSVQSLSCPFCGKEEGQSKAGMSQGLQRYKCTPCQRRYILDRRERGYPTELRAQALQMHLQGMKDRQIARQLGVTAPTVAHWIRSGKEAPPVVAPPPVEPPLSLSKESLSGRERPTISDVARLANVSTTTISNYLNDKGHMREQTRIQVKAAIEQLNFSPNALVRAIQKRQTRVLGVLLFGLYDIDNDTGGAISPPLLTGMNKAADHFRYDILLYTGWPHRSERSSGLDFLNGSADGLIWVAPNLEEPVLERVSSAGLPVVSLLSRHVPESVGYVNLDNFGAMRTLVGHLVEQGHRRIAFAGAVHDSNSLDRRDGYREALTAHGLAWDKGLEVTRPEYCWDERKYLPILERWLNHPAPPTAIVAVNDGFAESIIAALQRLGRRVPEDCSVCGFDDTPFARSVAGGLTTIHQPFRSMGELAVERLIALIEATPVKECRVTVPGSLVVRATTSLRL